MLAQIVQQVSETERLLERAFKAVERTRGLRSGDRVYTPLVVTAEFDQGNAPSANLIFNVPADADFWAHRLCLFPSCKVIDPVNGTPDEVVFRPTSWAGQAFTSGFFNPDETYGDFNTVMDGMFALIFQGKELQNADVPASGAYCADVGKWLAQGAVTTHFWAAVSQTMGGYVFDVPFFIPRGKSLTLRFTPTYLGVRTIVETILVDAVPTEITRRHRYKLTAVLEGEKRVSAFR